MRVGAPDPLSREEPPPPPEKKRERKREPKPDASIKANEPPVPAPAEREPLPSEFAPYRFHFTPGVGPGETARIVDDEGRTLLTYRGFASVVGIVAFLVAAVMLLVGLAAALFLILLVKESTLTAIVAVGLAAIFAIAVLMRIPSTTVTLLSGTDRALTIAQLSKNSVPKAKWGVLTPDGRNLATLQKGVLARLGRHKWTIVDPRGRRIGYAADESLVRAVMRKFGGKFDRRFEADVVIVIGGRRVATIFRRPDSRGNSDVLEITGDTIDHRVAVAVATLILGSEP